MAKKSYEEMIEDIEKVLEELDNKELPLEEAVAKYKEGMKLIEACGEKLEKVEKDLRIIEGDENV
jgi:exodeoxyribonuclease VII small subunit